MFHVSKTGKFATAAVNLSAVSVDAITAAAANPAAVETTTEDDDPEALFRALRQIDDTFKQLWPESVESLNSRITDGERKVLALATAFVKIEQAIASARAELLQKEEARQRHDFDPNDFE